MNWILLSAFVAGLLIQRKKTVFIACFDTSGSAVYCLTACFDTSDSAVYCLAACFDTSGPLLCSQFIQTSFPFETTFYSSSGHFLVMGSLSFKFNAAGPS